MKGIPAAAATASLLTAGLLIAPTGLLLAAATATASDGALQGLSDLVPDEYVAAIQLASDDCPGLPAPLLAAQLAAESGFSPDAVSPAGAQGIAQFMPGTWHTWGRDADGDGTASPFDPDDAIAAQGTFMCQLLHTAQATDWGDSIDLALAGYNAGWGAVAKYQGVPPYPETRAYVERIRASAARYAAVSSRSMVRGSVDAMLPSGYRNGRSAQVAVAWALGQVGAWRDQGYCLRFVARAAYDRPWDGASIHRAHQVWDNAPAALRHPGDYDAPRGAVVIWDGSIGGGAGHIAISLGDGRMVTTTRAAVAIRAIRGFASSAYLGWMPPYFTSG